jgi:hypothetical protein
LQFRQHLRCLLFLALHGKEQKEIEDPEDEKNGKESQQGIGLRRLKKQSKNHV